MIFYEFTDHSQSITANHTLRFLDQFLQKLGLRFHKFNFIIMTSLFTSQQSPSRSEKHLSQSSRFKVRTNPEQSQKRGTFYGHIPLKKDLPQWNQSSSTLLHSAKSFHFSRGQRFPSATKYQDSQQLKPQSSLCKRSASIGYGKRVDVPQVFGNNKFRETQGCPFYETDCDMKQRSSSVHILGRCKSFGLGWKYYEAAGTPHRKTVHSSMQVRSNPGIGRYNIEESAGHSAPKMKMHGRLPMFTSQDATYKRHNPSPQKYLINEKLVTRDRGGNGLGFGEKIDFSKLAERSPGPIYDIRGFCDKFSHLKLEI